MIGVMVATMDTLPLPYHFTDESAAGIVRVEFTRDLEADEIGVFFENMMTHVAAARRAYGKMRLLIVTPKAKLRTQQTAEEMEAMADAFGGQDGDKVAVVVESALVRLQSKRISIGHRVMIASTEAEARDWLTSKEAAAA